MLTSHLLRAALFGALAGWLSYSLLEAVTGWWVYILVAALGTVGGWVLVRPMERNALLASAVLWVAAGVVYYLLRPPVVAGFLGVVPDLAGYAGLAAVILSLGVGVMFGKAITKIGSRRL